MKLRIVKTETVEEEVDVDFPLYVESWDNVEASAWTSVYRIDETGHCVSITARSYGRDDESIEAEVKSIDLSSELPYFLTLRQITAQAFNGYVEKLRKTAKGVL